MGRAKPIMIQGTMSNAGKSLLAAGLCRVLSQDGLRVTPFKSQNMALNSGVTADGLEMGRAQIMQAEACGIAPDVRMNPILLKPESGHRSQLIVAGKAQGAFAARDYFARKKALMPQILEAFDSLAEENDVIVIEGAGSPAEINLAENDIVNMGLARAVSSPVLLAGDIDPGGVFAQLYGTVALLAPEDRALLRGLVVNKFRGDVEILRPGLAPLEKMCGVPVVGVVPYLTLDLDDEDSLAPRLSAREARGVIDVAVVRLPHLSNFTDFDPLSRVPGVGVRYVSSTTDLGRPDLVVLPGSKTTLDDARWLAASGIGACVRALSGAGTPVLGICGGYQLLGDELSDPHGREGAGTARGLGLIPAKYGFQGGKAPRPVGTAHHGRPRRVLGVERHDGARVRDSRRRNDRLLRSCGHDWRQTRRRGLRKRVRNLSPRPVRRTGVALALARSLARMRGLPESVVGAAGAASAADHRAREFDRLADVVRGALDMEYVYRIIEEGV